MAIKIGVIGCGTVAGYGHIPGILEVPEIELAAISDLNAERLSELQNLHNIPDTYTDYNDLLARSDIDAVAVATPVQYHYPVVMAAAKAGKHVFCEKPIAESPEKGMEMVQAMNDAGKLLAINFENRVSDPFPEMKKLLDAGEIGNLRVMRFVNNWMGGRWASEERYRSLIIEGKGPIVDCGVHYFDMARWFSESEFANTTAIGVHIEDYPNPDHVIATCEMDNGVISLIEGGWAYTHNTPQHHVLYQIELIGDRGIKLSGGQRQRLSIARAVLKNPPIMILDEATSALDTESERLVQEALEALMKNRTSVVIAHRLSTIQFADEIIVLNDGEVAERGTHSDLMTKNGIYKKLCDMQSFLQ